MKEADDHKTIPNTCDHWVGWLHFHSYSRDPSTPRRRPRIVRQSQRDDVINVYRFQLIQNGASYDRAHALSDEMIFALCCVGFSFCPLCGAPLARRVQQAVPGAS
jgi:hypothetical protein